MEPLNIEIREGQEWVKLEKAGDKKMFSCPQDGHFLCIYIGGYSIIGFCPKCGEYYTLRQKRKE